MIKDIEALAESAPKAGLTLDEILAYFDQSAFGAGLFFLALPCCVPFIYIIPQIVALPMAVLAFQLLMGRKAPWLPAKLASRTIDKQGLKKIAHIAGKYFSWTDKITKTRLRFMSEAPMIRILAIALSLFCLAILLPIPGTNTAPGVAVALMAFGLINRDGLLILAGLALGSLWISLLVGVVFLGFMQIIPG